MKRENKRKGTPKTRARESAKQSGLRDFAIIGLFAASIAAYSFGFTKPKQVYQQVSAQLEQATHLNQEKSFGLEKIIGDSFLSIAQNDFEEASPHCEHPKTFEGIDLTPKKTFEEVAYLRGAYKDSKNSLDEYLESLQKKGFTAKPIIVKGQQYIDIKIVDKRLARIIKEKVPQLSKYVTVLKVEKVESYSSAQIKAIIAVQSSAANLGERLKKYALPIAIAESDLRQSEVSHMGAAGVLGLNIANNLRGDVFLREDGQKMRVEDFFNPWHNSYAGLIHFKELNQKLKDIRSTIMAYNAGIGNFYSGRCEELEETQNYLGKVLALANLRENQL